MDTVLYYAPTYFSPYYFAPLVPTGGASNAPAVAGYSDRDAFAAIVDGLSATGAFADVVLGDRLDERSVGASRTPLALVMPERWSELDDVDPSVVVRQVWYTITLVARGEQPADRFGLLDRFSSLVQNTLDGSTLGGGCLPALTKLRRGRYDPDARYPEQRVVLEGEFSYLIPSLTSHNT